MTRHSVKLTLNSDMTDHTFYFAFGTFFSSIEDLNSQNSFTVRLVLSIVMQRQLNSGAFVYLSGKGKHNSNKTVIHAV